jgi:HPt (histidine-containing phosphotransfer) domain-containing protein
MNAPLPVGAFAPDALLELLDGDMEIAEHLLGRFLEQAGDSWGSLEAAVHSGQSADIARRSHFLKGSVALLGAQALAAALENWEVRARDGALVIEAAELEVMGTAVAGLVAGIRAYLASGVSDAAGAAVAEGQP